MSLATVRTGLTLQLLEPLRLQPQSPAGHSSPTPTASQVKSFPPVSPDSFPLRRPRPQQMILHHDPAQLNQAPPQQIQQPPDHQQRPLQMRPDQALFKAQVGLVDRHYRRAHANYEDLLNGVVDHRILEQIAPDVMRIGINPGYSDHERLLSYIQAIKDWCRQSRYEYSPNLLAGYLMVRYKPSTAHQYMIQIQTHVDPDLKDNAAWRICLKIAKIRHAKFEQHQAVPATTDQIRKLIGDLSLPVQRAIFQQYVLVGRFSESLNEWDEDGNPNLNIWHPQFFDNINVVRIIFKTHKGSPTGSRPFSKWVNYRTPSFRSLFMPHNVDYPTVLNYIKQHFPNLTTYSLRYAAIHRLQEAGFQPQEIALLSGHSERAKIPSLNRVYMATLPNHADAITAMNMSSVLLHDLLAPRA